MFKLRGSLLAVARLNVVTNGDALNELGKCALLREVEVNELYKNCNIWRIKIQEYVQNSAH